MIAPIMRVEDLPKTFYVLCASGELAESSGQDFWADETKQGNAFATEADAMAARDAWLLIKQRAMERAK